MQPQVAKLAFSIPCKMAASRKAAIRLSGLSHIPHLLSWILALQTSLSDEISHFCLKVTDGHLLFCVIQPGRSDRSGYPFSRPDLAFDLALDLRCIVITDLLALVGDGFIGIIG